MTMIILGIVGVGVMFSGAPTQLGGGFPYFMALLGALFLGISSVVIRKLHRSEETAAIVAYFLGVGAVIALPAVVSMRHVVTLAELYWIVPMIIAGTVAQFFLTKSFQYAPASIVYPFTLSEVLCSTLFGVVMFGEVLTQSFIIGAALIIFSAVGIMWSQRQAPKSN
jgi:drug/metabolite transporter (DMT)-like permease